MEKVEPYEKKFSGFFPEGAELERLFTGSKWAEGPVYFTDCDFLLWSDIPNDRILQWVEGLGVRTWRSPSGKANGNTRDIQGRLITCEHGTRRLTRTEYSGQITVLADHFKGKRLNSPNDVTVKSDGTIWFTDPDYGILSSRRDGIVVNKELEGNYVYRLDPATKEIIVVADDFVKPNGIAFSPQEDLLYVSDTGLSHDPIGPHHIRMFKVTDEGKLDDNGVFCEVEPGVPDGFRVDTEGNLWTSAADGVHCYSKDGNLLGKLRIPEKVSNLTFGGNINKRLYITATTSVYAIWTNQKETYPCLKL